MKAMKSKGNNLTCLKERIAKGIGDRFLLMADDRERGCKLIMAYEPRKPFELIVDELLSERASTE